MNGSDFLARLEQGGGDGEILAWLHSHGSRKRTASEILFWSAGLDAAGPSTPEAREKFEKQVAELAPHRVRDIHTNFERSELDDFVSFGGRA